MTEIWKNGFCQKVDIYKRNFLHNLAKDGHIDVRLTVLNKLLPVLNDTYYFLKDLGKSIFGQIFTYFVTSSKFANYVKEI